ncbi:MAG: hypothetical protein LBL49_02615 [Clostridiales Family XIII bacterium]|nr:hypothetical protein [Clostridiales Family XIII bacterium]
MRNGEPDEIIQQEDGSVIWIYSALGSGFKLLPSGERVVIDPGYKAVYYFNNPLPRKTTI